MRIFKLYSCFRMVMKRIVEEEEEEDSSNGSGEEIEGRKGKGLYKLFSFYLCDEKTFGIMQMRKEALRFR